MFFKNIDIYYTGSLIYLKPHTFVDIEKKKKQETTSPFLIMLYNVVYFRKFLQQFTHI